MSILTLGDALPREMTRVRDRVIPAYLACGPGGGIAVLAMRRLLDEAARATANGDVAAMAWAYQGLKGCVL